MHTPNRVLSNRARGRRAVSPVRGIPRRVLLGQPDRPREEERHDDGGEEPRPGAEERPPPPRHVHPAEARTSTVSVFTATAAVARSRTVTEVVVRAVMPWMTAFATPVPERVAVAA